MTHNPVIVPAKGIYKNVFQNSTVYWITIRVIVTFILCCVVGAIFNPKIHLLPGIKRKIHGDCFKLVIGHDYNKRNNWRKLKLSIE